MDWLRHSTPGLGRSHTSRTGFCPAHLVFRRSTVKSSFHPRLDRASGRSASRHYPDPFGKGFERPPTPRPCPPWLHGHYPLHRYYEDSDPDRPFGHRPWFPDSSLSNFDTFHLQSSAVLDQTRSTPSTLAALFCSGFAVCSAGSPEPPTETSSPCPGIRTLLRTARSLPVALHPGVWPRRSYFQLLALQCRPGQGLAPCCSSALSGARSAAFTPLHRSLSWRVR